MYFFYLTQRDWNCIFELTLLENNNLNLIWKIYCMVFFNFLVMCSYKNAIYCYKYDIDIWIQSIILTSFYSFLQGAGGSFNPNSFELYTIGIRYLEFDFCYLYTSFFFAYPMFRPWWSSLRPKRNALGTQWQLLNSSTDLFFVLIFHFSFISLNIKPLRTMPVHFCHLVFQL